MRRRNPATSTTSSPSIDMTSLMDVVFIFLFVVMIGYTIKCAQVEEGASQEKVQAEQMQEEYETQLASLQEKENEYLAQEQLLNDMKGDVLGERVKLISIYCTYEKSDNDPSLWNRQININVLNVDKTFETLVYTESTCKNAYNRVEDWLRTYIENESDKQDDSSKSEMVIIVLSLNQDGGTILKKDHDALTNIIERLEKEYDNVY